MAPQTEVNILEQRSDDREIADATARLYLYLSYRRIDDTDTRVSLF